MKRAHMAGRLTLACAAVLLGQASVARATECGDVITSNLILEKDLTCVSSGLIIAADGVTVNLNGFTITGVPATPEEHGPAWSGVKTQNQASLKNVRVKNGTIVGFDNGVFVRAPRLVRGTGAVIQNMTLVGQNGFSIAVRYNDDVRIDNVKISDTAQGMIIQETRNVRVSMVALTQYSLNPGIHVRDSSHVSIGSVYASGPDPYATETPGIMLDVVEDANVQHVYVRGFRNGVAFVCYTCSPTDMPDPLPNSGRITDSVFAGSDVGVSLDWTANVTVTGNSAWFTGMWDSGGGIGGGWQGPIRDLNIVDNAVHYSTRGLLFLGVTNSRIDGNVLVNNWYDGLAMWAGAAAPSGNEITSNIVLDNGIDLQCPDGALNEWRDNVCRSASGDGVVCDLVPPW